MTTTFKSNLATYTIAERRALVETFSYLAPWYDSFESFVEAKAKTEAAKNLTRDEVEFVCRYVWKKQPGYSHLDWNDLTAKAHELCREYPDKFSFGQAVRVSPIFAEVPECFLDRVYDVWDDHVDAVYTYEDVMDDLSVRARDEDIADNYVCMFSRSELEDPELHDNLVANLHESVHEFMLYPRWYVDSLFMDSYVRCDISDMIFGGMFDE